MYGFLDYHICFVHSQDWLEVPKRMCGNTLKNIEYHIIVFCSYAYMNLLTAYLRLFVIRHFVM
jgi:hypothetical protein